MDSISSTATLRKLRSMRDHIAAYTLMTHARRLSLLAAKAGYRPNQARRPAGNRYGGQWTDEGSAGEQIPRLWLAGDHPELPPEVPEQEPPTIRERNSWGVRVAKYLAATSPTLAGGVLVEWLVRHGGHRIRAYLIPARTLQELQDAALEPRPGFDIHHIVEQTPARQDGLPQWKIDAPENKVAVPTYRHWEITGWYNKQNRNFGGLSPREFLRGKPWEVRRAVGLEALQLHGVLKP